MNAKSHSIVMLRRDYKHIARNPTSVFNAILMPVVIMFMFVYTNLCKVLKGCCSGLAGAVLISISVPESYFRVY